MDTGMAAASIVGLACILGIIISLAIVLPKTIYARRAMRYAAVAESEAGKKLLDACWQFATGVFQFPQLEWHFRESVSTLSAFSKDWERWLDRKMNENHESIALAVRLQPERDKWDRWIAGVIADVVQVAQEQDERSRHILEEMVLKGQQGGGGLYGVIVPDIRSRHLSATVSVEYNSPGGRAHRERVVSISGQHLAAIGSVSRDTSPTNLHRSPIPRGLRIDILRRDGYRCKMCGRSSKSDGVALEVDHIQPSSLGGPTVSWNLQTLCRDCNRGKSNRFEE